MNEQMLHSHSGIEREMCMSKHWVLIDARFMPLFTPNDLGQVFNRKGIKYVEVKILAFIKKNGVFKNYDK